MSRDLDRLLREIQDPNSRYNRQLRFEQNLRKNRVAFEKYKNRKQQQDEDPETLNENILKPSERIILRKKETFGGKFTSIDWYRSQMFAELSSIQENYDTTDLGDTFGFEIGKFYFFGYDALYPYRYPYWDRFPLSKILEMSINQETATIYFLGANVHYLSPEGGYRGKVGVNMLNSLNYVPDQCLHTYVLSGISSPLRVPDDDIEGLSNFIVEEFVDKTGKRISPNNVWKT
jgi:hypothetical protein